MLPPLSIDVSLPGLPVISHALHAPGATIQWTLSAFVLAFGSGQLALGPLSDRYGRRPVLLAGIAAFTLTAFACAFATNVYVLIALRLVQGFGACAGTVCARAIVADVANDRARATSLQAYVSATNSAAPIVAPLLGVALLSFLGWPWLYGALAFVGIGLIVAVITSLHETSPLVSHGVIASYRRVLAHPRVRILALFVFFAFAAYFALISASAPVLETQMRVSSAVFALAFVVNACATMAGSFAAARCAGRISPERLLQLGAAMSLLAGLGAFYADVYVPSPASFTTTMAIVAFCFGLTVPVAFAAALSNAGADAGAGAAILGSSQMLGGAIGSALAGALPYPAATSVGIVVLLGAIGLAAATCRAPRGLLPASEYGAQRGRAHVEVPK